MSGQCWDVLLIDPASMFFIISCVTQWKTKVEKKMTDCVFQNKIKLNLPVDKSQGSHIVSVWCSVLKVKRVCVCVVCIHECVCVLTHAPVLAVKWILAIGRLVAANWVAPDASSTLTYTLSVCVCACTTLPINSTHTRLPWRQCNWLLWVPSSLGFRHKTLQKPAGSF